MTKRIIALIISFAFIFEQSGFAQVAGQMQAPGYLANLLPADNFNPVQLRSVIFNPSQENFRLMLDKGDEAVKPEQLDDAAGALWNYFLIGLRLPNTMFWVNLRPDAPTDIIDPNLEKTDLGRILLAADLQLKKDMARFTSPDTADGKQYWAKLYAKAEQLYGQADMEIPTITRPWIVPGEVIIKETSTGAYIYKAALNVMLEQDYIKDSPYYNFTDPKQKEMNVYSSELIRSTVLPRLIREINSSKRYAELRQVYYSVVLAQWFKQRLQGQENGPAAKIDSKDLTGLTSTKAWSKEAYYNSYKKSFSQGEYNKEETVNTGSSLVVRNYFSGGLEINIDSKAPLGIRSEAISALEPNLVSYVGYSNDVGVDAGNIASEVMQRLGDKEYSLTESIQKMREALNAVIKDRGLALTEDQIFEIENLLILDVGKTSTSDKPTRVWRLDASAIKSQDGGTIADQIKQIEQELSGVEVALSDNESQVQLQAQVQAKLDKAQKWAPKWMGWSRIAENEKATQRLAEERNNLKIKKEELKNRLEQLKLLLAQEEARNAARKQEEVINTAREIVASMNNIEVELASLVDVKSVAEESRSIEGKAIASPLEKAEAMKTEIVKAALNARNPGSQSDFIAQVDKIITVMQIDIVPKKDNPTEVVFVYKAVIESKDGGVSLTKVLAIVKEEIKKFAGAQQDLSETGDASLFMEMIDLLNKPVSSKPDDKQLADGSSIAFTLAEFDRTREVLASCRRPGILGIEYPLKVTIDYGKDGKLIGFRFLGREIVAIVDVDNTGIKFTSSYTPSGIAGLFGKNKAESKESFVSLSLDGGNTVADMSAEKDQAPALDRGGIDLRAVPMVTQPGMGIGVPAIDMKQLQLLAERSNIKDLDREWANIQKQIKGKQMPYAKMKEYVAVCCQGKAQDKHITDVMACVTNILKLEEKCAVATSPEMKELLVMIEAARAG